MFSGVTSVGASQVTKVADTEVTEMVSFLCSALTRNAGGSCPRSVTVDTLLWAFLGRVPPAFLGVLFSSSSVSQHIGVHSLLLRIAHLLLSVSITVHKQFYYVMLDFRRQLK